MSTRDVPTGSAPAPAPKKRAAAKKAAPAPAHHSSGGGGGGGGHAGGGHGTPAWFAHQVLAALGLPTTHANVDWMVAWESREGGHWENSAQYNPLNTTLAMPGDHGTMNNLGNGMGVRVYTSWAQGIKATADTLAAGLYSDIRNALSTGHVSLDQHFQSLMSWSGNGYDNVSGGNPTYNPGGGGGGGGMGSYNAGAKKETNVLNSPAVVGQFGYLSGYLNDPVLGPILRDYAQNHSGNQGWLLAQLEKTDWWKQHSQTAREMQALQKVDPASYKQQWGQQRLAIADQASQMGIHIDGSRLNQMATTSLWSAWTPEQMSQAIGAEFHYDPNAKYTGAAGSTISKLKAQAGDFLVPLSNQSINQWTKNILEGKKQSTDDYTSYLQDQAKTLFPWMAKSIDKGVSPTTYLDPYRQAAASTLELDPNKVDFTQAKWRNLFETNDPKTGDRSERGLANAMTLMRTDPRYGFDLTQGARQEAAGLAQTIAQDFGFAA